MTISPFLLDWLSSFSCDVALLWPTLKFHTDIKNAPDGGERSAAVNRGVRVFPRDRVQDHREERLRGGPDRGQKAARRKALGTLNRVSLLGGRWT